MAGTPTMNKFAKIFESDDVGQVLVMQDTNDDGNPALKIFFQPKDLGVCQVALGFTDDDEGWDKCDAAFQKADHETAVSIAREQIARIEASAIAHLQADTEAAQ